MGESDLRQRLAAIRAADAAACSPSPAAAFAEGIKAARLGLQEDDSDALAWTSLGFAT